MTWSKRTRSWSSTTTPTRESFLDLELRGSATRRSSRGIHAERGCDCAVRAPRSDRPRRDAPRPRRLHGARGAAGVARGGPDAGHRLSGTEADAGRAKATSLGAAGYSRSRSRPTSCSAPSTAPSPPRLPPTPRPRAFPTGRAGPGARRARGGARRACRRRPSRRRGAARAPRPSASRAAISPRDARARVGALAASAAPASPSRLSWPARGGAALRSRARRDCAT